MGCDFASTIALCTAFVVLLTALYWYIRRMYGVFEKKGISGPSPTFPFGTWNCAVRKFLGAEDITNYQKFGPIFGTFDGLKPNLVIADTDLIKEVTVKLADKLRDKRAATSRNPSLKRILQILGNENQQDVNQIVIPSIERKLGKLESFLEAAANTLVRNMAKARESGPVPVTNLITEFVQDASSLILLGLDLNGDPVLRQGFIKQSKQLFSTTSVSSALSALSYLHCTGDSGWILPKNTQDYFKRLILKTITERGEQKDSIASKAVDFLDLFLEAGAEEKRLAAKEKAQDIEESEQDSLLLTEEAVTNNIIAAHLIFNHWLRSTLVFSIYSLATTPEVQTKLWKEVTSEKLKFETIRDLIYLDKFLWEVLRLHPTEFRLERVTAEEVSLSPSLTVPHGTTISTSLFALHNAPQLYPDPEIFNPENFAVDTIAKRGPCTFFPFGQSGIGVTNINYQLALLVAKWTIYKLVTKFKFTAVDSNEPYTYDVAGVPTPSDQIMVTVESRG